MPDDDSRAEWWLDHSNLSALARWLIDEGDLPLEEVPRFLAKPWDWSVEFTAMTGRAPTSATNDLGSPR